MASGEIRPPDGSLVVDTVGGRIDERVIAGRHGRPYALPTLPRRVRPPGGRDAPMRMKTTGPRWRTFVDACGQPAEIRRFLPQAVRDYAHAMRCDVDAILDLPWMAPRMGQNAAAIAYRREAARPHTKITVRVRARV